MTRITRGRASLQSKHFAAGQEGGKVVVDASLWHVMLRGRPVGLELQCKTGDRPAVRMPWDESARRFVPERPRCVKERWPGGEANR